MPITVKHTKVSLIPDGEDSSVVRPSDWNADHTLVGLGTMAEQNANSVAITGGTISGVAVTGYVPTTTTITAGTGLTGGGDLSANRTLAIANTTVTAAAYGSASKTLTATVNAQGQLTALADTNIAIANTQVSGLGTASTKDAGVALGVATLDAGGKVPQSQIPLMGDLNYQGTWNASTNTPTLTSSVGTKGYYYVVDVSGNTNLNGITDWVIGDWAIFNGSIWQKVDNTDAVTSVNGQVGTVVLTTTNIAEGTNLYYTDARARASNSAGTGISYDNATGVITNAAPDQTVSLTGGTGISTSGTYPNFTITNTSPSLGGDVVGPTGATDNAVARYDTTTGKLLQNSTVLISDSGGVSGITTLAASTSVTTPIVQASNSAGLSLKNSAGTTQISMGAGGGDNVSINVSTNLDGANAQIDISPTGTGHVHIKPTGAGAVEIAPTNAGTMNNMVIGGTTPLAITGTTITATSFVGSGASLTNVVNSLTASTGISVSGSTGAVTVTNTAPDQVVSLTGAGTTSISGTYPNFTITSNDSTLGTVTSVSGTGTVNGISLSGTVTSSGNLTLGGTLSNVSLSTQVTGTLPIANGGTGETTRQAAMDALAGAVTSGQYLRGNGTDVVMSAIQAADVPTLNQNTTGTASNVTGTVAVANGGTGLTSLTANRVPYGAGTSALGNEADFTYDPSLNTLTAPQVNASNGIVVNSNTVSANYTIPSGSSAMSAGPMTVSSGVVVTVSSGSRWVVL